MNKQEYLERLRRGLSELPIEDVEERIGFYSEMIDDLSEEGLSEEEALGRIGSVEDILSMTLSEIPLTRIVKKKMKHRRRMRTWEIVLLAVGSPLWLTLGIVLLAVILSLYVVLWSLVAVLWAVFGALVGAAVGFLAGGIVLICTGTLPTGLFLISGALVVAGLSIFLFFGCLKSTVGVAKLIKWTVLGIKKIFVGKEEMA